MQKARRLDGEGRKLLLDSEKVAKSWQASCGAQQWLCDLGKEPAHDINLLEQAEACPSEK
jgi:hypothetical protein